MRLLRFLNYLARRLYCARRVGWGWSDLVARHVFQDLGQASTDREGRLVIPGLGCPIPRNSPAGLTLLRSLVSAKDLHQRASAEFSCECDVLSVKIADVQCLAPSHVDVGVLHEIFVEQTYAFEVPGDVLVIDIGANIGAASLYFAQRYGAEVRSFELVPSTADIAQKNFDLNPPLAKRISLTVAGVSDADGAMDIQVDPAYRPGNSLFESIPSPTRTTERVQLMDAAKVFQSASAEKSGRNLIAKIDAEGAEFEILERLGATDLLGQIDLIFLELHRREGKNPDDLRELLRAAGFSWFEQTHPSEPVSRIEAFRYR